MVATSVETSPVHDDALAARTEPVLGAKSTAADVTEQPAAEETLNDDALPPSDEQERRDVDEPRIDSLPVEEATDDAAVNVTETSNEPTQEKTTEGEMSDNAVKEILDRYAFGAGMRMYARSLALAELAEKEKAAKTLKKAPSSSLGEPTPMKTVPSAKSVLSFESVRSEISRLVQSLGSMDRGTAANNNDRGVEEDDDDDVVDAITHASEETEIRGSTGLCGTDDALADLFHQADIWAEQAYNSMARESKRHSKSVNKTYNNWWSSMFGRKNRPTLAKKLTLEEVSVMSATPDAKPWWSAILCSPVIVEDEEIPQSDEPDEAILQSDEQCATPPPTEEPTLDAAVSEPTKPRWEWPFASWFTKKAEDPTNEEATALPEGNETPAPDETKPASEEPVNEE